MAAAGPIVSKVEEAGAFIWQGLKSLGGAAKETGKSAKGAIDSGDKYVKGFFQYPHDGTFGGAIKGIAKEKPLSTAIATTAVVGGTVYAGKQVFGRHSERVMRERANDNERSR